MNGRCSRSKGTVDDSDNGNDNGSEGKKSQMHLHGVNYFSTH